MSAQNKLPLLVSSFKLLTDQLREQDRVAIVVYAGAAGMVLPPTSGADKQKIKDALSKLQAGGSTAGGAGIKLAYETARENFVKGGNNRVILATDGDFNIGASSDAALVRMIEKERESGVFLTVMGFGMGNYKDNKMQQLANKGNGNHAYIDNISEAKKVLVSEFGGTMFTIAKDVKLQIEFNPAKVQGYRLIGYENRLLNKEDFNDDKKDAGELGSGHTVTALYEIIPAGVESDFIADVDDLKYQKNEVKIKGNAKELMTIKLRYKQPDGDVSQLIEKPIVDNNTPLAKTSDNFRWSAAVAEFGMLLRESEFKSEANYKHCKQLAEGAKGKDPNGYRRELIDMIDTMHSIAEPVTAERE
jgi:Ca-activated chloride channel family protein